MKHKAFYNGKKVKVVEIPDGECEGYLDDLVYTVDKGGGKTETFCVSVTAENATKNLNNYIEKHQ